MHHDDPLEELIKAAEAVVSGGDSNMHGHYTEIPWSLLSTLSEAIAPFRPDPEEELLNDMASSMRKEMTWYEMAKSALAVIKEKGYFNDQR